MSREIKFRAWDGVEMHYNVTPWQHDFVIDLMIHKCIESNGSGFLGSGGTKAKFEVPGIAFKEIMQFTGLHDKNGKEIWEGDILFNRMVDSQEESGYCDNYVEVAFQEGAFGWIGETTKRFYTFSDENILDDHTLAGNIHEHPHLLNPGQATEA